LRNILSSLPRVLIWCVGALGAWWSKQVGPRPLELHLGNPPWLHVHPKILEAEETNRLAA
jgi:hypothetical protein